MRMSDWSSDVCSSDLPHLVRGVAVLVGDEAAQERLAQAADHRQALVGDEVEDRAGKLRRRAGGDQHAVAAAAVAMQHLQRRGQQALADIRGVGVDVAVDQRVHCRSEEHTSELQSLMRISYAVLCLKKKKEK